MDHDDEVERLRQMVLRIPTLARQVLIRSAGLFGNPVEQMSDIAYELEMSLDTANDLLRLAAENLADLMLEKEGKFR